MSRHFRSALLATVFSASSLFCQSAFCQSASDNQTKQASITGTVHDAGTGKAIPGAEVTLTVNISYVNSTVIQSRRTKEMKTASGPDGNFSFEDVPPGTAFLRAVVQGGMRGRSVVSKRLTLKPSQRLAVDLGIVQSGSISGKVLDENGEPVADVTVFLVAREYSVGGIRELFKGQSKTNDEGRYTLTGVVPGKGYLVYAEQRGQLPSIADDPDDPKLRRKVLVPSFYPNSTAIEGAASVTIQPTQNADDIDIKMKKADNLCLEGLASAAGTTGKLMYTLSRREPSFGMGLNGGMVGASPHGKPAEDGRFRVCGLSPGEYVVEAEVWPNSPSNPPGYGVQTFVISDRDVKDFQITAVVPRAVGGEVVFEAQAPAEPVEGTLNFRLQPTTRTNYMGENANARVLVPGPFSLPAVLPGEYRVYLNISDGYYASDVLFGGLSVLYEPVRLDGSSPSDFRVLIASGPASMNITVTNQDGKAIPDVTVIAFPADTPSEAALCSSMFRTQMDQDGAGTLSRLPAGKYKVMAVPGELDGSLEQIRRLMADRNTKGTDVILEKGATAAVSLTL